MPLLRLGLVFCLIISSNVQAKTCNRYTDTQLHIINTAYSYGVEKDYGYTLAAITIKESFVGNRIVRINPSDPSFGITHIHFDTLKHLSGMTHYDAALESEKLITDDALSWEYSIKKLDTIKGSWWYKWKRYNGNGPAASGYANSVRAIIQNIKQCNYIAKI